MPSYLDIALRVTGSKHPLQNKRTLVAYESRTTSIPVESLIDPSQAERSTQCGSPECAGCYQVEPGVRIHPPKCGRDYFEWLNKWDTKARVQ